MVRRMAALAVLVACYTCNIWAQNAKVVALSAEDAALAKSLYEQKAEIEKRIDELHATIERKYLLAPCTPEPAYFNNPQADKAKCLLEPWIEGFVYSEDFQYVVPLHPQLTMECWDRNLIVPGISMYD